MDFDKTKPYIFFSYAHKDSETGKEIIKGLQENGFNLWFDEGIKVGTEYSDYIAEHIQGCKVFVCLMDENYIASRYCRDEIDFALNIEGVDILIIYRKELKDLKIPAGLKMRTSRYQAVFLNRFPSMEKFMESMVQADILSVCNEELASSKEKVELTVYEENGFNPTFQQRKIAEKVMDVYALFGVKIEAFTGIADGPQVTRYEFKPAPSQRLVKILELADDVALAMGVASLRIICPIPGKTAFGVEVPSETRETVHFQEIFESEEFKKSEDVLSVVLGRDVEGRNKVLELSKAPHVLIAGRQYSGKTTVLHNMIISLIKNTSPEEVKLVLMDTKKSEFGVYENSKHLLMPVITDEKQGIEILNQLQEEMIKRYELFANSGVRDIRAYNQKNEQGLYRIVVFIDEATILADPAPKEFETAVARIAQRARAAGIHLVMATGSFEGKAITGIIKANMPTRIALSTNSVQESYMIVDCRGAEKLFLNGDMLYQGIGDFKPTRIQGAFVDFAQIPDLIEQDCVGAVGSKKEEELEEAIELAEQYGLISAPLLEQRMGISHAKALKLIKSLDEAGLLEASSGRGKPRKLKTK
ncbi:MAG: TIR domain-containing protein [Clostridia bacterium]|nr:TIR domain-containing protein [Clostridia bacterium]